MTLPTMNPGDRVRITVEGVCLKSSDYVLQFTLDSASNVITNFALSELTAPTARVEVLPPPIDPDLVLAREWFKARPNTSFTDEAIDEGYCDNQTSIQGFLAGLKASKAGGRV